MYQSNELPVALRKFDAFIFDVDDTLMETLKHRRQALLKAARDKHYIITDEEFNEHVQNCWGKPFEQLIQCLFPGINFHDFNPHYMWVMTQFPPKLTPATNEILAKLAKAKKKLAAVTSSKNDVIRQDLKHLNIEHYFGDRLWASDDLNFPKPDPRSLSPIIDLWEREGIKREKIVKIGDGTKDCQAALGNGINFIGVLTGRETHDDLCSVGAKPEHIYQDFWQLLGTQGE